MRYTRIVSCLFWLTDGGNASDIARHVIIYAATVPQIVSTHNSARATLNRYSDAFCAPTAQSVTTALPATVMYNVNLSQNSGAGIDLSTLAHASSY